MESVSESITATHSIGGCEGSCICVDLQTVVEHFKDPYRPSFKAGYIQKLLMFSTTIVQNNLYGCNTTN